MSEKSTNNPGIGIFLQGSYKLQVIDAAGNVVEDRPWKHNLILNCGMEQIATANVISDCNSYGIVGSGSRPNYFGSTTSAVTQSGNQIYLYDDTGAISNFTAASSSYGSLVQLGDTIQYTNLSKSMVTAVLVARNILVNTTHSVDLANSQSFRIWKTSQSNLEMEAKRGGNGVSDSSWYFGSSSLVGWNFGSQIEPGTPTIRTRRTYVFSAETGNRTYTEGGVSWRNTFAASSSFARFVIDPPLLIGTGFRLRMAHDLAVTYSPWEPRYITASILNWPNAEAIATNTYATESIQSFPYQCSFIDSNGNQGGYATLEPSQTGDGCMGFATCNSASLTPPSSSLYRYSSSSAVGTWLDSGHYALPYVPLSFERFKSSSYGVTNANTDRLWFVAIGRYVHNFPGADYPPYNQSMHGIALRFNQPQLKTAEQKLTFVWRWQWDRELIS